MSFAWFIGVVLVIMIPCILALLGPKTQTAKGARETGKGRCRSAMHLPGPRKRQKAK